MEITEELLLDELYRNLSRRDSTPWSSLASVDLTSDEIPAIGSRQSFAPAEDDLFKETWPLPPEETAKEYELYLADIGVRI